MFSVCFESALVADAVVHTNMLTVVNNGITIFAEKMVIVVIITPDCMFMAAIKFVKAAEIAYVPNSVMGFYVTEIGKTVRAVFDHGLHFRQGSRLCFYARIPDSAPVCRTRCSDACCHKCAVRKQRLFCCSRRSIRHAIGHRLSIWCAHACRLREYRDSRGCRGSRGHRGS